MWRSTFPLGAAIAAFALLYRPRLYRSWLRPYLPQHDPPHAYPFRSQRFSARHGRPDGRRVRGQCAHLPLHRIHRRAHWCSHNSVVCIRLEYIDPLPVGICRMEYCKGITAGFLMSVKKTCVRTCSCAVFP